MLGKRRTELSEERQLSEKEIVLQTEKLLLGYQVSLKTNETAFSNKETT